MPERYDLVVIGAGPGGYVAAIRAAQLGMRTACVDSRATLGGTCLNIGCIPSKALLQSSEKFVEARHALAEHGVRVGEVGLDLAAMMARKDKVVGTLTRGVEFLFRKNKVDWLKGRARIAVPGRIALDDGREIEAGAILIATGSESIPLPGSPSTSGASCPRPARWRSTACPSGWQWSAPAISDWNSARCGRGS